MLRAIGDIVPIGLFVTDIHGRTQYVNSAVLNLLDPWDKECPEFWPETIHPEDCARFGRKWADCLRTRRTYRGRYRLVTQKGETVSADIVIAPVSDSQGCVTRVVGIIQRGRVPERPYQAEQALRLSEKRYRQIIDTAQEGIWLRDAEARTIFVNRRLCEMLGYTEAEMLGRPVSDFMDPEGRAEAEKRFARRKQGECQQHDVRYKHKDGSDVWAIVSASPMFDDDGNFLGGLGMVTDITERKRSEETIRWQAYHDPLTGLANRSLLEDRLQQLIAFSGRQRLDFAVMFIDLDRFKQVNDTLGHDFGDRLLKVIAGRISGCLRAEDTIARMGGDEFAALLPGVGHVEDVTVVSHRLLEALAQPVEIADHEVFVAGSIGVSLHPGDGNDVTTLLKHADLAMYRAKEQGGNRHCLFTDSMSTHAQEHVTLETSLRRAFPRGEFHLVYQPQVDLDTREICSVEALCRWRHPELGLVPPSRFIPLAEEAGLIVPLGEWALREACRQAAEWQQAGRPLRVAVNLSARQFAKPDLPDFVRSVLAETGLEAQWLELELTESALMKHAQSAVDVLHKLRDLGVRLALDDFGTGYSSLSYLRQFPFDVLKIDRSFVSNIVEDYVTQALVRAIIELSCTLDLEVVAEGVECDDQRRALRALGCRIIQGYLFSPPVSADSLPLSVP